MQEFLAPHWPELALAVAATLLMLGAALRTPWRALGGAAVLLLAAAALFNGYRACKGWAAQSKAEQEAAAALPAPAAAAPDNKGLSPLAESLSPNADAFARPTPPAAPQASAPRPLPPRKNEFVLAGEPWALLLCALIQLAAAATALLGIPYLEAKQWRHGEFFALLAFAALGLTVLARAADFITLFLGLETASIALYCLTATLREREKSLEGALKYFILGAAAAAFLLFGAALLYGATGHFGFAAIFNRLGTVITPGSGSAFDPLLGRPLFAAGLMLVLVALAFKAALVPFHMWAPDAYSGAATPVTAFMMVATKTAVIAVLIRLGLQVALVGRLAPLWSAALLGLGLLTLFVANAIALVQRRAKRLFAYTAVSSSGFVVLAVAGLTLPGADKGKIITALAFYLASYLLATLGLLAALTLVEAPENLDEELKEFTGLAKLRPRLAFIITVLLFSAAGLPGTAGFLGKFFILRELISAGAVWPAALAILLTVVATAYYLRVIILMYMRERDPDDSYRPWAGGGVLWLIGACALLSLLLGLMPQLLDGLIAAR
jgi:NADH-quinone oxidoreductase subunit N